MRIDQFLVSNYYFKSRSKAQDAIKQKAIYVDGKLIEKPSYEVTGTEKIEVRFETSKYVSRGGYKLEKAILEFNLDFSNKVILDIGSSTGGFTDCAIQNGARLVYSVDVGSNQLDDSLRNNSKIIVMENTNILDIEEFDETIDYLVMDVSFVSIKHVIPALIKFINERNSLVCLIKPQFEVGKMINKGIIKDKKIHYKVLEDVILYLKEVGLYVNQLIPSPIKGGSGNIEFLALVSRNPKSNINIKSVIEKTNNMY